MAALTVTSLTYRYYMPSNKSFLSYFAIWSFPTFNFAILCSIVGSVLSITDADFLMVILSLSLPSSFFWAVMSDIDDNTKFFAYSRNGLGLIAMLSSYFLILMCFDVADNTGLSSAVFTVTALFGTLVLWLSGHLRYFLTSAKDKVEKIDSD